MAAYGATAPKTLCEAFQATAATHPDAVALRTPDDAVVLTWRVYADRVRRIAAGLASLGVRHGETVGIMLTNRPEFHLVDTGAMHLGAVPFSVYNTLAAEQLNYVLANAGNRIVICEEQFLPVVRRAADGTAVERIVCVDAASEGITSLRELESMNDPDFDFEARWKAVEPHDLLTVIYTSGTTGPPKGVELTHANLVAQRDAVVDMVGSRTDDSTVSYLPDAHIANRLIAHYLAITDAFRVTTLADIKQAVTVLPEVRPTIFVAVPQVWYKIKAAIEQELEQSRPLERRLARWAIDIGRRKARLQSDRVPLPRRLRAQHSLADRAVLGKIRRKLGLDRARIAATAAAPISPEVVEFVLGLGIPCCEAWGLSETCAAATINPPSGIRIGTVGKALGGVEVARADDGELLVAGPTIMKGYRGDPVKTAETIDADGWLHTGDVGTIDADGYVRMVDRKKEMIINSAGKNMSPSNIEGAIRAACPLIGGAAVVGDDRPYLVALLTLDPEATAAFAARHGLRAGSHADLASNPLVRGEVDSAVAAANERLSRVEQVRKFALLPTTWEPAGDEFTPTMKLRRGPIDTKYAREIEALYAN